MNPRSTKAVNSEGAKRGNVVVLFAVLLPFLVGGMALSVDTGVIGTARSQMQTAADAAALAGASQIAQVRHPSYTSLMMSRARTSAVDFVSKNRILGCTPVLNSNTNNSPSGEIVIGYLNPADTTSATPDTTRPALEFNSVKINLHRDSAHGGVVPNFFSSLFSSSGSSLHVSSVATMRAHRVVGFRSVNKMNVNLLPIVLDQSTYDAMISGATTDQYDWRDTEKTVYNGSDGITESKLYPVKNGLPGNWGTIKVGVSNNSTSTLGDQIRNGITPAQLATFPGGVIQLNPSLSPPSITFEGNPGISAGIKDDLTSIIGRPVFIPIYDQSGGNGNNAWYRVVKFAGVRILSVNFNGNPKYVIVQPALVTDAGGIPGTDESSLDDGGLVRLYLSR